jgi:hypothetical protein
MQSEIRTSLIFPATLHQQLLLAAKRSGKSVTRLVQEFVSRGLASESEWELEQTYEALRQLDGLVKDRMPNNSTTIDEALYGEKGMWRGEPSNTGIWVLPEYANDHEE